MATALSSWSMVDVCRETTETTETTIRSLLHPHSQVIRPPISFVLGVCSGSKRCQVFAVKSKRSTCDGWATNVHKLYCHTILALMGFEPILLSEHRLFITQITSINIKTRLQNSGWCQCVATSLRSRASPESCWAWEWDRDINGTSP